MTVTGVGAPKVPWPYCREPGCAGAQLDGGRCLAHVEGDDRQRALAALARGRPLEARGVRFGPDLLASVLASVAADGAGRPVLSRARLDRATFPPGTSLGGVVFAHEVSFDRAHFAGDVSFDGARFEGPARFAGTDFAGLARFTGATFDSQAWFGGAVFRGPADFGAATWSQLSWFGSATFGSDCSFDGAHFEGHASFGGAAFGCHSSFAGAVFDRDAGLDDASFHHPPRWDGAAFKGPEGAPATAMGKVVWAGADLARWSSRAAGAAIDAALALSPLPVSLALGVFLQGPLRYRGALAVAAASGVLAGLALAARMLVEQGHTGRTPGKSRLGLCLVRARDGRPVGPALSLVRHLLHLLDWLPAGAGWMRPAWHERRQTFADSVAKTLVVRGRGWARIGSSGADPAPVAAGGG